MENHGVRREVGHSMGSDGITRMLILGGGFVGLYAAMQLEKILARDATVEVTLINCDNFFLFTPMLHEVAASDLDLTHIVNPVQKLLRRVKFFAGDVEAIDLPGKRVVVSHGFDHHHHDMSYDHLVIALGSITNFFNLPGLQERALTMKSLGDAITLRNRLIALLEEANSECCAAIREPLLTVVVAGGGFAGVETIAAVNDSMRHALKFYLNCQEQHVRMVLVHPGPVILPELPWCGRPGPLPSLCWITCHVRKSAAVSWSTSSWKCRSGRGYGPLAIVR